MITISYSQKVGMPILMQNSIHTYVFRFCFIFPTRFLNMYLQVLAVVVLSIFAQTLITPFSMHLDSALSFKLWNYIPQGISQ